MKGRTLKIRLLVTLGAVFSLAMAGAALVPAKSYAYYWKGSSLHSDIATKDYIIQHESSGHLTAVNPYGGACGLMQAYPCSKLAHACPDWRTNWWCQMNYFENYMQGKYHSWDNAYQHSRNTGWW